MKKLFYSAFALALSANFALANQNSVTDSKETLEIVNAKPQPLSFIKNYKGKTVKASKLLDNPIVKARLIKLIGNDDYVFLKKNWNVEEPISVVGNTAEASGCKVHDCGNTNFILLFDITDNIIQVGIRKNGGKALIISEDPERSIPGDLEEWSKRNQ
ncbi:hypothetical protein [Chryseobacterium sp. CT-SW4]|uniref:hypothetical protein n=1 Tax=Chryseobacterium sp. SW-1 TaxID=3157343 RepID=UPI003B02BFE7